jgi:hypothetical protein
MSTHRDDLGLIDAGEQKPKITTAEQGVRSPVSQDGVATGPAVGQDGWS